jgi:beta-lactamase superfamily II metal-dependent hydrolase
MTGVAWRLEIHHIDVTGTGDATLIIAREVPPLIGAAPIVRSVLIDGGRRQWAARLHNYIGARLPAGAELDAMICTHYDDDHVNGLIWLLEQPGRYDHTVVYDQGWPGNAGQDANYIRFLKAINGWNNAGPIAALAGLVARNRVTAAVQSDGLPPLAVPAVGGAPAVPAGGLGAILDPEDWLLNGMGAPAEILWNGAPVAAPAGAPTMQFIAANGCVRTAAGGVTAPILGLGTDPKNEKSLAVEVTFGNFRYYAGGDIETGQENWVQLFLNNANTTAGRVLAMKTSHHGARTATSRTFVNRLRPSAAFISCGTGNARHPAQQTVNILDGYPPLAIAHPGPPPLPPNRPVEYYLTGYQNAGPPPLTYGGDVSLTAGDPVGPPIRRGHIRLTVQPADALVPVQGQTFFAVEAAVQAALTAPGLAGVMAPALAGPIATAAAEEAMRHGAGPAASMVITQAGGPGVAGNAADNAANGPIPAAGGATVMANLVTTAALNAGAIAFGGAAVAAHAAGAGAAAGTCYGGGTNAAVQQAVASAVQAAGLTAAAAAPIGAAATAALPPAPGATQFRVRLYAYYPPHGPAWVILPHR